MEPATPLDNLSAVKNYYEACTKWYRFAYYDRESLAIHYGFWDKPGISRKEALINQYVAVKKFIDPKQGELVLDAGCGVGGASLWLAQNTPASYLGITLSETQVELAEYYAKKRKLAGKASFCQKNYFSTGFPAEKFDKIFAIESFCYAYPNPLALYQEMFRILKPGGRMLVSDGVILHHLKNKYEEKISNQFLQGFKMSGWNTPEEIINALQKAGFINARYIDKTKEIGKSVNDLWRKGIIYAPGGYVLNFLGIISKTERENLFAMKSQKSMYKKGLLGYGIFIADKK